MNWVDNIVNTLDLIVDGVDPSTGPVTDDIGKMAKIQLFYVGFGQEAGLGIVHIDGQRVFYHAHSQWVKKVAQRS